MPSRVDLHTHSTASDGTLDPHKVLDLAIQLKIRYFALSDHDSTEGWALIAETAKRIPDFTLVPAVEMSAEGKHACHILGYWINPHDTAFQNQLQYFRKRRIDRLRAMAEKLGTLGFPIDFDALLHERQGRSIGRPHLADALVQKGVVKSRKAAFDRFLKKEGPAYIPNDTPTAEDIIQLIRRAGGVPVLAHPSYYTSEDLVKELAGFGLMGIEAYYPEHGRSLIQRYADLAKSVGIIVTGGSDFHGPKTGRDAIACIDVPEEIISALEDAKTRV